MSLIPTSTLGSEYGVVSSFLSSLTIRSRARLEAYEISVRKVALTGICDPRSDSAYKTCKVKRGHYFVSGDSNGVVVTSFEDLI